jgi:VanZ family protein
LSRIFFATICLIIYGSLYPWHFQARELPANPVWILIHAWPGPGEIQIDDVALNILLYAPLGLFGFLSLAHVRRRAVQVGVPIAIGFALSFSMEILQLFDLGRDSGALDVLNNTAGSGVGVLCGVLFESSLSKTQNHRRLASLLLLVCFVLYQLSPFLPEDSVVNLQQKFTTLMAVGEFSVRICLVSLVEWLAVARLVETAIDKLWRSRIYFAIWMLIPARMLIAGRTTTGAELAGAALAYLVWRYGLQNFSRRAQLLAVLFTSLIIFRGLAPYQFTHTAAPFSWIPFRALFAADRLAAITIFLGKAFAYGMFVWLLRDSGWRVRYAAVGAAATLGAIEAAQMFLPGRVPEITDPLIALLLAWIFWLVDDSRNDSEADEDEKTYDRKIWRKST